MKRQIHRKNIRVLFVCRSNIGRSQIAQALYENLGVGLANSAGTQVDIPGQKLIERKTSRGVLAAMAERDIDISDRHAKQLTQSMLDTYEKVIVMAEPETFPDFLQPLAAKVTVWSIPDAVEFTIEEGRNLVSIIEAKLNQQLADWNMV